MVGGPCGDGVRCAGSVCHESPTGSRDGGADKGHRMSATPTLRKEEKGHVSEARDAMVVEAVSKSVAGPAEETSEPTPTTGGAPESAPLGHVDDFDFLAGSWRVHHRRLVGRLVGSTTWEEFDGECRMQKLLSGQMNIDDNVLYAPGGTYRAATVRVFDPTNNAWSIFWIDSRYPPSTIDDPVVGGFQGRRGVFFSDDEWEGRQVRTRFIWHIDGPDSCRWEQALSPDGGTTWETNWHMHFAREASREP
jgi:hypothetical protein